MTELLPSILAKNKTELEKKIKQIEGLVKEVQIDIADNKFVPNKTITPDILASIKTNLRFEVHLMVKNPEDYISQMPKNTTTVIFHAESTKKQVQLIKKIKDKGFFAGVAINPETSVMAVKHLFGFVDQVLLMTVHPGFYGAKFEKDSFKRLDQLKRLKDAKQYSFQIEVDGGQDKKNALSSKELGADKIVSGSYIFESKDIKKTVEDLKNALDSKS